MFEYANDALSNYICTNQKSVHWIQNDYFTQESLDTYLYHSINQKILSSQKKNNFNMFLGIKYYIKQVNDMNKPFCKTLQNIDKL